jgi:hypothetical protein
MKFFYLIFMLKTMTDLFLNVYNTFEGFYYRISVLVANFEITDKS